MSDGPPAFFPKTTHIYTRDPISNFQIRVHLRRVARIVRDFSVPEPAPGADPQEELSGDGIMTVFHWQQKILSKREYALFKQCTVIIPDALGETYRKKVHAMEADENAHKGGSTLFTYINQDGHVPEYLQQPLTTSAHPIPTRVGQDIESIYRGDAPVRPSVTASFQSMHVMVGLQDVMLRPDQFWSGAERTLCTVTLNENGRISMTPGFTAKGAAPYSFEVVTPAVRCLYEYTLTDASPLLEGALKAQIALESRLQAERTAELRSNLVGSKFTPCPPSDGTKQGPFRLCTRVEVVSATGFPHRCLYAHVALDYPDEWQVYLPPDPLTAQPGGDIPMSTLPPGHQPPPPQTPRASGELRQRGGGAAGGPGAMGLGPDEADEARVGAAALGVGAAEDWVMGGTKTALTQVRPAAL
ncbi:putative Meckel syndrome type 1 protein [Paratrimastix pyriformis]|uniref:Meckel syndrome type 1 protein n=1 Tax=Paratrimastix pyriformis TaxID=342808 RepID=A0ABQ8USQ8_9EUKA|nr:putative Meckel syndrome type 1 protein [Paratrimastix pyriformis]